MPLNNVEHLFDILDAKNIDTALLRIFNRRRAEISKKHRNDIDFILNLAFTDMTPSCGESLKTLRMNGLLTHIGGNAYKLTDEAKGLIKFNLL
jgi:hypothetical protein